MIWARAPGPRSPRSPPMGSDSIIDQVEFRSGTSDLPDAGIAGGSAHTATAGMAIHNAGAAVIAKLADLATNDERSPLFGAGNAGVIARDGRLFRRDDESRSESYADILGRAGLREIEARGKGAADPAAQSAYAMHAHGAVFAEVKVDPDLGQIRVTRLVGAFAAGRIINPRMVQSQLFGGMIWGVSFALHEQAIIDRRSGRIMNANLGRVPHPGECRRAAAGSDHGRGARSARQCARHQGRRRDRHHRHGRRGRQRGLACDRRSRAPLSDPDRGSRFPGTINLETPPLLAGSGGAACHRNSRCNGPATVQHLWDGRAGRAAIAKRRRLRFRRALQCRCATAICQFATMWPDGAGRSGSPIGSASA